MTGAKKSIDKNRIDMTEGPLLLNIIKFMIPLILTNMLQHLYHSADIIIVGMSNEPDAVGAVGSPGSFLALITNIFIGFSVGANVVVARSIGSRDNDKVSRTVHTSVLMSVIFGTLGAIVGIALTRPILVGMGYTGNLLRLAARYSYIYLACMPFMALTSFLVAILHASGNTRTSLHVMTSTGILNVILNLFFVMVLGLSVEGVAIATAISNIVSGAALWTYLARKGESCRLSFGSLRISRGEFLEVARIGFPAGIQSAMFSLSNMLIQSSILDVNRRLTPEGSAYAPVIKGNSAASDLENFIFQALAAITAAASAFTAQNVGAKNYKRVRQAFVELILISIGLSVSMTVLFIALKDPLLSFYGVKKGGDILSEIAYDTAMKRIAYKWTPFFLFGIMNASSGAIRGLGRSGLAALVSFFTTCVFRVVWIYTVFKASGTLESIYLSYPVSWILSVAVFLVIFFVLSKRKIRENSN